MKKLVCLAVIVMSLTITGSAFAALIYSPVTNHSYEVITVSTTWTNANVAAVARGGYLAVITSAEENKWIWDNLGGSILNHYWLGGIQGIEASGPRNGWSWVTSETWDYTNWDTVEPNDWDQKNERYLQFSEPNGSVHNTGLGKWNDALNNASSRGYIVESNVTPEPATMSFLGLGLAGLLGLRRKKA